MKASELRQKSSAELQELLAGHREEQFKLRMQHFTGQLENVSRLRSTRRTIARLLTIIDERTQTATGA